MNNLLKQQAINTVVAHSRLNSRHDAIVREMEVLSRCKNFTTSDVVALKKSYEARLQLLSRNRKSYQIYVARHKAVSRFLQCYAILAN